MPDETPLSESERAELEELRAQAAEREARERVAQERAELQRLRAEQKRATSDEQASQREVQARARARKLMEPDDELRFPLGQKIVLVAIAIIVVGIVLSMLFAPK